MASFGERLKLEREKRGITLEEISLATKIGTRMLRALEEERFHQLPGGIFNKGFVRAYARQLGIDEEQAIADYLAAAGESQPRTELQPSEESFPLQVREEKKGDGAARIPWGGLAIGLLAVSLGFAAWNSYSRKPRTKAPPPARPSQAVSPIPPASASAAPAQSPALQQPDGSPKPPAAVGPSSNSGGTGLGAPSKTTVPPPEPSGTRAVASSTPAAPTAVPEPGSFIVLIKAREDSWLEISADGKQIMRDTLVALAEKSVQAQKEIVIKAGNAGALDFSFNGRRLPVQGNPGQVKTVTFGPNGLQVPPPKPQPPAPPQAPPG